MKKLSLVTLLVCILGCSETKIITSPEYASQKTKKASLVIDIKDAAPTISYSGELSADFGFGDKQTLLYSFFKKQLQSDILRKTKFTSVNYARHKNTIMYTEPPKENLLTTKQDQSYKPRSLSAQSQQYSKTDLSQFDKVKKTHLLPSSGSVLEYNHFDPGFILLLSNISIGTETSSNSSSFSLPGTQSSINEVFYKATFTLWDNKQAQHISYGSVVAKKYEAPFSNAMDILIDVSDDFVEKLFENTPFYKDNEENP